ncbi:MAG: hypothetical protein ACPG06_05320 [Alphaproteobacteria bacterium]
MTRRIRKTLSLIIAVSALSFVPGPLFASDEVYQEIRTALGQIRFPFSCVEPMMPRAGVQLNSGRKRLMINDMADYEGCVATEWHNAADQRAEARDKILWAMRELPGNDPALRPLKRLLPRLDEFEDAMANFVDEAVLTRGRLLAARLTKGDDDKARSALVDHLRGTAVILDARDRLSFLVQALSHGLGRCDGLFQPVEADPFGPPTEIAADFEGDGVADLAAIEGSDTAKQIALYLSGAEKPCPPHLVVAPDQWPEQGDVVPHIEFTQSGPAIILLHDRQPWKVMRVKEGALGPLEDYAVVLQEMSAPPALAEEVEADEQAVTPPPPENPPQPH